MNASLSLHTILAADEPTGGLAGLATSIMNTLGQAMGGPGAGLANALDSILPFLPSEVILPLAGYSVSQGHLSLFAAILWTTIGSVVGSVVMYYLGALLGRDRTRAIAARIPLVKVHEIDRTEAWFNRHGVKAVLFGRMVPVFRSLISVPAGIERMALPTFVAFTALGSLVWNTVFVLAGYLLGANWHLVEDYTGVFSFAVVAAVVLAVGYFVATRLVRARRERTAADEDATQVIPVVRQDDRW